MLHVIAQYSKDLVGCFFFYNRSYNLIMHYIIVYSFMYRQQSSSVVLSELDIKTEITDRQVKV